MAEATEHIFPDYNVKKGRTGNGRITGTVTVAQLDQFDEIIDVRSEDEFAEDHIPGAVNYPVLNNAERAEVGTIYKQVSSFDAKKIGVVAISLGGYYSSGKSENFKNLYKKNGISFQIIAN